MAIVRRMALLSLAACWIGASTAAWACDVSGKLVCDTDSSIGLSGVTVTMTLVPSGPSYSTVSGSDGSFATHVAVGSYDVNVIPGSPDFVCTGTAINLGTITMSDPQRCPSATAPMCPETWNPAHQPNKFTGVPAGWSTLPGTTNPATPQNPDGFFKLIGPDGHDLRLIDGCPGFGGKGDGGTGDLITTVSSGTVVKFTEANGKNPGFEPMAGNNGQGGGISTYVDLHVWGQGDLYVCDNLVRSNCTCCYVPPPPFTPPLE